MSPPGWRAPAVPTALPDWTPLLDEIGEIEGVLKTHTSVLLALRVDRTG